MVELMRKAANTDVVPTIELDTAVVKVSKNWFVVIGTCESDRHATV